MKSLRSNPVKRFGFIAALAVSIIGIAACGGDGDGDGSTGDGDAVSVAVLFEGKVDDAGFNEAGFDGLERAGVELGVETAFSEAVPEADYETTMRDFAERGFDLVIGHGFLFSDAALAVGSEFPETDFAVTAGDEKQEPNVASVQLQEWAPAYLAGVLAAEISESGQVGYIGGEPIPPIAQAGNAFREAAEANGAEVLVTYTGSFNEAAKGKRATLALIDEGADVTLANAGAGSLGSIEATKERGVQAIGFQSDQASVAPDTVVASFVLSWDEAVFLPIQRVVEDQFTPEIHLITFADGVSEIVINPEFEEELVGPMMAVNAAAEELEAGQIEAPSTEAD